MRGKWTRKIHLHMKICPFIWERKPSTEDINLQLTETILGPVTHLTSIQGQEKYNNWFRKINLTYFQGGIGPLSPN